MSAEGQPATWAAPPDGSVLTNRQLNRSYLARQLLLERESRSAASVIEHLAGMQSQVPKDPFIGIWTRIADFDHAALDRLMLDREAVRIVAMRGTIHLLTSPDAYLFRPPMQAMLERFITSGANFGPNLTGLDLDAVAEAGRQLVDAQPSTGKQIGDHLAQLWPDRDPSSLSQAVRSYLALVQITPRGVWGRSMQPTLTTIEAWLGQPIDRYGDPDAAILRYLAAFGPATVADIQAWSSLPGLAPFVERLRPRLVTYRDERNRELLDVSGAPFPPPETPAPVRFLPGFDNALLSHADRTRIIADTHRKRMWTVNGLIDPSFLVDGYVAGSWKATSARTEAVLDITPFTDLEPAQRAELEAEGHRLLTFLHPSAEEATVRFADFDGGSSG